MPLRYIFHKPFTVRLPDKCEWEDRFNPDNKGDQICYMNGSKTNKDTGAGMYRKS